MVVRPADLIASNSYGRVLALTMTEIIGLVTNAALQGLLGSLIPLHVSDL